MRNHIVAIDCEMYEVDNHKNALGRVSVVNQDGQVLYDNYVLP